MSRYEKTGNGTILDTETGLERQAEPAGPMTRDEAVEYAKNLDLGGHNDWRLPSRFEKTKYGTIIDALTGLEWQADYSEWMSQGEGEDYAKNLDLGGHNDWRLPTIKELITLIDFGRRLPVSSFPGMPGGGFWSSSVYADDTGGAWIVIFGYGYVGSDGKDFTSHVRCVRRGPLGFTGGER